MSDLNTQYLKLYSNYAKALRDIDLARKRKYAYEAKKAARSFLLPLKQFLSNPTHRASRRPIGAPADYSIPIEAVRQESAPIVQRPIRINMGPILGIVELQPAPTIPTIPDTIDMDQVEDEAEKKHFEIAYANYWYHRRAFFNFLRNQLFLNDVRKKMIKKYFDLAEEEAQYQANLQFLGLGSDEMEQLKAHIQKACKYMYSIYRNTPKIKVPDPQNPNQIVETNVPESIEVLQHILNVSAEAMLAGLDTGAAKSLSNVHDSIMPKLAKYKHLMK